MTSAVTTSWLTVVAAGILGYVLGALIRDTVKRIRRLQTPSNLASILRAGVDAPIRVSDLKALLQVADDVDRVRGGEMTLDEFAKRYGLVKSTPAIRDETAGDADA